MSRKLHLLLLPFLTLTIVSGTVVNLKRMDVYTMISPPVVWFEDPYYPGVYVELYNYKTRANVYVNTTKAEMRLLNRTGHVYDLRDQYTVYTYFEQWGRGCSYYMSPDGTGIEVTGNPTGGLYGGCVLRYKYPLDIVNLTAAFTMRTNDTGTRYGIRGVILANATTGYYYMIGLKNNGTGWFFGIYKYTGATVREPGGPSLPSLRDVLLSGYIPGIWFNIVASYIVYPNGTVAIKGWLYNVTGGGTLVASISVIDTSPIPRLNTFGVGVYQIVNQPSAVFQMVAFTQYYYVIVIRGLGYCCNIYAYDSSGALVGSTHVNETGVAEISLDTSIVSNGTITITCGGYTWRLPAPLIIGGDIYEIYFAFVGPILNIYSNATRSFTGWLRLYKYACRGNIYYVHIGLANQTYTTMKNVTIIQYSNQLIVVSTETEMITFTPYTIGWIGNVTAKIEMYYNTTCSIILYFQYNFTAGIIGSNVINLTIRSV